MDKQSSPPHRHHHHHHSHSCRARNDSLSSLSNPNTVDDSDLQLTVATHHHHHHPHHPHHDDEGSESYHETMDGGDTFDDNDSALGGSLIGYDTQTIASYITDYRYENGRRYHAFRDGEYWGPNDEPANEQQDLAHHLHLLTLDGKLHLAPLDSPQNILDVGTGNGIWATEMADTYSSALVIGTDLSPVQSNFVPPNCVFEIEDLNSLWTYPPNHFDFIHVRELFGCVTDWSHFFEQAFTHTKPGGYVEIMEHSVFPASDDGTMSDTSFYTSWGSTVVEMGEKFGKSFKIWEESKWRMERAGFVDVVEKRFKWPVNDWPSEEFRTQGNDGGKSWKRLRELGIWNQLRLYNGVEGFMIRLLTTVGGWTYEVAQDFLDQMQVALMDLSIHAYLDVSVVYGRKPGGQQEGTSTPTTV